MKSIRINNYKRLLIAVVFSYSGSATVAEESVGGISLQGNCIVRSSKNKLGKINLDIYRLSANEKGYIKETSWPTDSTALPREIFVDEKKNLVVLIRSNRLDIERGSDIISIYRWSDSEVLVWGIGLRQLEESLGVSSPGNLGEHIVWSGKGAVYSHTFERVGIPGFDLVDIQGPDFEINVADKTIEISSQDEQKTRRTTMSQRETVRVNKTNKEHE